MFGSDFEMIEIIFVMTKTIMKHSFNCIKLSI